MRAWLRGVLSCFGGAVLLVAVGCAGVALAQERAQEPPKLNPFGKAATARDDALPGYLELSDGTVLLGRVYLTRDKRLKIYDDKLKRQREVPLSAIEQIEGSVEKEWLEREWRFQEAASDQKVYTGRHYPAREYLHTLTLHDGKTITGPLAEIIFVEPTPDSLGQAPPEPRRFNALQAAKGRAGGPI